MRVFVKAGLVEHRPGLAAEVGQVARIEADAGQFVAVGAHLAGHFNGLAHALQRVVGIHQKHRVVGKRLGVGRKSLHLIRKRHHPAVGVGAAHRNAVALPGQHVAGGIGPAQVGRPAGPQAAIEALGAAQAKLQHLVGRARPLRGCGRPWWQPASES